MGTETPVRGVASNPLAGVTHRMPNTPLSVTLFVDDDRVVFTKQELEELPFDLNSWCNWLAHISGQVPYAEMTARPPGQSPEVFKVVLTHKVDRSMNFDTLRKH